MFNLVFLFWRYILWDLGGSNSVQNVSIGSLKNCHTRQTQLREIEFPDGFGQHPKHIWSGPNVANHTVIFITIVLASVARFEVEPKT